MLFRKLNANVKITGKIKYLIVFLKLNNEELVLKWRLYWQKLERECGCGSEMKSEMIIKGKMYQDFHLNWEETALLFLFCLLVQ